MVLDKVSIKNILCPDESSYVELREKWEQQIQQRINEQGSSAGSQGSASECCDGIFISSTETLRPFAPEEQIGTDSIDLRIAAKGYIMIDAYEYLNTLSTELLDSYFKEVDLSNTGYLLNPGDLLFVPTLEKVALCGDIIGRVTGRSVFARMGLSVHCTQDKFASGINSVVGLQVINNSPIPLKIYPYQKIAQLMIEKTGEIRCPYKGHYFGEITYMLPQVHESDLEQYDEYTKTTISKQQPKRKSLVSKTKQAPYVISLSRFILTSLVNIIMAVFGSLDNIPAMYSIGIFGILFEIALFYIDKEWLKGEK